MQILDILNGFTKVREDTYKIGKSNYWILVNPKEITNLKDKFILDEESINQCITESNRSSKIIFFDGYIFLSLNILGYRNEIIESRELNIYLSKDYIITVCKGEISIIKDLIEDIKNMKNCFMIRDNPKPSIILYYILDRIIVKNYNIISDLETKADKIEISILKNPLNEHADELIHLRRQVYKIRKYLNPLRYIGDSLVSNDNSIFDENDIKFFHNINQKINKLMLSIESLVQDLALVREAFESEIANKTNGLMKVFTVITSIFLPLNLLTSMQGMNFENIPFVSYKYGYYYTLGIMIVIVIILMYIFRRKRWL
ncbi:magnesium transporter CorA family protein [Clostridium aestuarii]|uniref:Magnesium transporter CorA family protein n=1 Tax=Clostridium aestuarii TaxID=338193 RepID=A0ABT4D320_9CLOT|nr:magnesium transporter CorA family protein [Clostridium aestuarii]MCY6484685.1 magnesium transporter CorA family protein [Clostridium aestuarii]